MKKGGKKFDNNKPMMDTIPPATLFEMADIFSKAARGTYGKWNYMAGIPYSKLYAALQRHLNKWNLGIDIDPQWNRRHLAHALCELVMLMNMPEEFDDRFWKGREIPTIVKEILSEKNENENKAK